MSKSQIYFGRVKDHTQSSIFEKLGHEKGELPFKYLGVPLSTKKLSVLQCKPLIEKITHRITS